jgi:hypothetical protein
MAIELNQNISAFRDINGHVRHLSHNVPYRSDCDAAAGYVEIARQYLKEAAEVFEFSTKAVVCRPPFSEKNDISYSVDHQLREEKHIANGVLVIYDQVIDDRLVWDSNVSVRFNKDKKSIVGSHNATHYDIQIHTPGAEKVYTSASLKNRETMIHDILAVNSAGCAKPDWAIGRELIYQYTPENRFDDSTLYFIDFSIPDLLLLFIPGMHYMVTELLFSYPSKEWGGLKWRVFVEQSTGAILYIRVLASCVNGSVFEDTSKDSKFDRFSDLPELEKRKDKVALPWLKVPRQATTLNLLSNYVKLEDRTMPTLDFPSVSSPFNFEYPCDSHLFAAFSAFYHCERILQLMMEMGFDLKAYFKKTGLPIIIDPHASKEINAVAHGKTGGGLDYLAFGTADGDTLGICVDPRVILHELGHAILQEHIGSSELGFAHSPGDSLAAILQDPFSKLTGDDRYITFPFMKTAPKFDRNHKRDVAKGWGWFGANWDSNYNGEQVLSSTLFKLYQAVGGDSPDMEERLFASKYVAYLIFKSVAMLGTPTPHPEIFADILKEVDAITINSIGHPGGALGKVIRWSFEQQGLYSNRRPVIGPGKPPEFDICIDDGRKGGYLPYGSDFNSTPGVWNRHYQDGLEINERPRKGVANYAYVKVANIGMNAVADIVVEMYRANTTRPENWPQDWTLIEKRILPYKLYPTQSMVTESFRWIPQNDKESILFSISASGDISNTNKDFSKHAIRMQRLVFLDNNIAVRTFDL